VGAGSSRLLRLCTTWYGWIDSIAFRLSGSLLAGFLGFTKSPDEAGSTRDIARACSE